MSKVDTLVSLIAYQKEHPQANDSQVAAEIGITPKYLKQCRGEINLLKKHLSDPVLEPDYVRLLMSRLNPQEATDQKVYRMLQKCLPPSGAGVIRMASSSENPPYGWLEIGTLISSDTEDLERLPPSLDFWLSSLCYEPLFRLNRNGELEWRLATAVEPVNGYSRWRIHLKPNLYWSDGKSITADDVKQTLSKSVIVPQITEIKTEGKHELYVQLSQETPSFPLLAHSMRIRPAHSNQPYQVTSGPYRLKHSCRNRCHFRLECSRDYYRQHEIGVDWVTIKCFKHAANAIRAVDLQQIDLLHLRALTPLYRAKRSGVIQQCPFGGDHYYLLFLNRWSKVLSDQENCHRLVKAIDRRVINRYLHGGHHMEEQTVRQSGDLPIELRMAYLKETPTSHYIARFVAESISAAAITPVSPKRSLSPVQLGSQNEIDVFFRRTHFGMGFNSLPQYFGSDGAQNPFSYANPQVDEMLSTLNQTPNIVDRKQIGQRILSFLAHDFAIIVLAPCFEYVLSPLSIQFDKGLTSLADLAQNMSELVVERNPARATVTPLQNTQ